MAVKDKNKHKFIEYKMEAPHTGLLGEIFCYLTWQEPDQWTLYG